MEDLCSVSKDFFMCTPFIRSYMHAYIHTFIKEKVFILFDPLAKFPRREEKSKKDIAARENVDGGKFFFLTSSI